MHSNTVQETKQSLPFGAHLGPRSSCRPFLWQLIFIKSWLKHQDLIYLARCLGLCQGLASTTLSTHCQCCNFLFRIKYRGQNSSVGGRVKPPIQGNFWSVIASLRISAAKLMGLDAAKSMGLDVAKSMGLDVAKSWLGSLRKFQNRPLGLDCKESCDIKPKTQVFHRSVTTKLSKNARSPNLSLASLNKISQLSRHIKTSIQSWILLGTWNNQSSAVQCKAVNEIELVTIFFFTFSMEN